MNRYALLIVVAVFLASNAKAQAPSDESLVQQFFPDRLSANSSQIEARGGPPPLRRWTLRTAMLDGPTGPTYIVAAYTNGFIAAIRVLKKTATRAVLVADPQLEMHGVKAHLDLRDLDGDGRPEIIAAFSSPSGGTAKWVFKWTGTDLTFLGPSATFRGKEQTILGNAAFEDIDGDGILEILDPPATTEVGEDGSRTKPDVAYLYALRNGKYQLVGDVNFFATFVRASGKPVNTRETFTIAKTDQAYEVAIETGGKRSETRADSAVVKLNGANLLDGEHGCEHQFGEDSGEIIVRPVTLLPMNTLDVELHGKPGSRITVLVRPATAKITPAH